MLATALTWGAGFGVLHLTLVTLQYSGAPAVRDTAARLAVWGTLAWAIVGALGGLAFGALVVALERRRTLATLSLTRFALLGLLAGACLMLLPAGAYALLGGTVQAGALAFTGGLGAALGGGIASASLWLARRGARELGAGRANALPPVT